MADLVNYLVFMGEPARAYDVYGSIDLLSWKRLGPMGASGSLFGYLDRDATNHAFRFYRAVQLAPPAPPRDE